MGVGAGGGGHDDHNVANYCSFLKDVGAFQESPYRITNNDRIISQSFVYKPMVPEPPVRFETFASYCTQSSAKA